MPKITEARLLLLPDTEELRFLPEGPTAVPWPLPGQPAAANSTKGNPAKGNQVAFSWVAIQHGAAADHGSLNIFEFAEEKNTSYALPGRPGFAKPTSQPGVFVVGCERELGLFDIRDHSWRVLVAGVDADVEGTIINDGTLYGDNIVFGTKDLEFKTPKAGLYLYRGRDGHLIRLRADQVCSNGKDVIDAGGGGLHLLDIDSPTKKLVRYRLDLDQGELSEAETLVDLTELEAVPDGMTVTPDEQSVIISFYNPNPVEYGETRQYNLISGELEHVWQTPYSPRATCPLLLETNSGVKLIITTAVEHMPADQRGQAHQAGGLFIADTDFHTAPPTPAFPVKS